MDKTFFVIIIPQIVALLIVGLTFLFNHLNKNREFKHNEHLKKLELEQREKERKFKVEEKMIEKSIDAHMELFSLVQRVFGLVNSYYAADGTLVPPDKKRYEELDKLLQELTKWISSKGFLLDKTIRKQIELVISLDERALKSGSKAVSTRMDIGEEEWKAMSGLRDALEAISKEYNPLYDLGIKLPEIEI